MPFMGSFLYNSRSRHGPVKTVDWMDAALSLPMRGLDETLPVKVKRISERDCS